MFFYKTVQNLALIAIIYKFAVLSKCEIIKKGSYFFTYAINSKDVISQHTEERLNDVVTGSYSFLQPDGKIRVVHYQTEGRKGFRAYVKFRAVTHGFKGHLRYPKDFQHPIRFLEPVSTIPRSLLGPSQFRKKHNR